jgi:hypothetical protein
LLTGDTGVSATRESLWGLGGGEIRIGSLVSGLLVAGLDDDWTGLWFGAGATLNGLFETGSC